MIFAVVAVLADRFLKVFAQNIPPITADFSFVGFGFVATRTTNVLGMVPIGSTAAVVVVGAALLFFILTSLKKNLQSAIRNPAILFVIFGGASNLYDRLTTGAVIDVFRVAMSSHAFVFNIADGMIVFGLVYLSLNSRTSLEFRI